MLKARLKLTHDKIRLESHLSDEVLSQPTSLPRWNRPLSKYQFWCHNSGFTKHYEPPIPMRQTFINTPQITYNCFLFHFFQTHNWKNWVGGWREEFNGHIPSSSLENQDFFLGVNSDSHKTAPLYFTDLPSPHPRKEQQFGRKPSMNML